jgi:hypothetical protein
MSPTLIERSVIVVAGVPAVGKTTILRREWGRDCIDIARLLHELLLRERTWREARETVASIAGGVASAYWPSPGLDALRLSMTATRAAAVEFRLTQFAVEPLRKIPRGRESLLIETTPVAAIVVLQACIPGDLVLVDVDETIRVSRIAARLEPERRAEAVSIARFQRTAHRTAWEQLRRSASYGWRVSERVGEEL